MFLCRKPYRFVSETVREAYTIVAAHGCVKCWSIPEDKTVTTFEAALDRVLLHRYASRAICTNLHMVGCDTG